MKGKKIRKIIKKKGYKQNRH